MIVAGFRIELTYDHTQEYILLGGGTDQYRKLYEEAMRTMQSHLFYRPMVPNESQDMLFAGWINSDGKKPLNEIETEPQAQHLGCFVGGMVGVGSKVFGNEDELADARRLTEGCLWAYESMPLGIMPEVFYVARCQTRRSCPWNEDIWLKNVEAAQPSAEPVQRKIERQHLPRGFTRFDDTRYILR